MKQNTRLEEAIVVISNAHKTAVFETRSISMQFKNKINNLISQTPTGDLRNELTELNILFESLNNQYTIIERLR